MKIKLTEDWQRHSESQVFASVAALEDDLNATACEEYAQTVLTWVVDDTQDTLIINNGPGTEDRYDKVM